MDLCNPFPRDLALGLNKAQLSISYTSQNECVKDINHIPGQNKCCFKLLIEHGVFWNRLIEKYADP